jgi:hypothetical protein
MELTVEQKKKIDEIMSGTDCSQAYTCYRSGFKDLCKCRIIGDGKLIECLSDRPDMCSQCFTFGSGRFCKCPLRIYIAKTFNK